jgi:SAM-dependent methyltransferase
MLLNIDRKCDFCAELLVGAVYHPRNTKRGMEVHICEKCGLIQSFSTRIYLSNPPPSMSCNADRASIRYTKDLIIDRHMQQIKSKIQLQFVKNVLDIGSNRGAFIRKLIAINTQAKIDAIEPEPSVSQFLGQSLQVTEHITRFEFTDLSANLYDFIYLAHTLEHLISASASLLKIFNLLVTGGSVFIAVPNMESIASPYFEEQFIDTHTYHFTEKILTTKLKEIGFDVISLTLAGSDEICILAKKGSKIDLESEKVNPDSLIQAFRAYPSNLSMYREELREIGANINSTFSSNQVIFWGAGRIFDGLIKIGEVNTEIIKCVIDKTLSHYMKQVNGVEIHPPSALVDIDRLTPIIVCSREYAEQIKSDATHLGFKNVRHFMEFTLSDI